VQWQWFAQNTLPEPLFLSLANFLAEQPDLVFSDVE
jgi:hypothetical protein